MAEGAPSPESHIKLPELNAYRTLNYYQRLGLVYASSQNEIKASYKERAKQWHPDMNQDNDDIKKHAEELFKLLNEAYEVLSDSDRRSIYDNELRVEERVRSSGGSEGADFSDTETDDQRFARFFRKRSEFNPDVFVDKVDTPQARRMRYEIAKNEFDSKQKADYREGNIAQKLAWRVFREKGFAEFAQFEAENGRPPIVLPDHRPNGISQESLYDSFQLVFKSNNTPNLFADYHPKLRVQHGVWILEVDNSVADLFPPESTESLGDDPFGVFFGIGAGMIDDMIKGGKRVQVIINPVTGKILTDRFDSVVLEYDNHNTMLIIGIKHTQGMRDRGTDHRFVIGFVPVEVDKVLGFAGIQLDLTLRGEAYLIRPQKLKN